MSVSFQILITECNLIKHVMDQTVEAKVQRDGERERDARGCDSPTYRVLPRCLCHHTEATEEVVDSAGRGSWDVAKNISMALFHSVLDNR